MPVKVNLPVGKNDVTTSGLFQWDYGQILEIETTEIGTEIVEVHFACPDMSEAIVCSCSFLNGVGTVQIPDRCLEQSSTISAWIYRISGTQGYTWKVIHLPVTSRTRPSVNREIPQEVGDKYTQLITEINETVDALENGNVTAAKAQKAENATYAEGAGNAANANHAVSADGATTASKAKALVTTLVFEGKSSSVNITVPGLYYIEYSREDGSGKNHTLLWISSLDTSVMGNEVESGGDCIEYVSDDKVLFIGPVGTHVFRSVRAIPFV